MEKVLISSCLLGNKVRYNASGLSVAKQDLAWLKSHVELIAMCPEVYAGLSIPRAPAEIILGQGAEVIDGKAVVMTNDGHEVTAAFLLGAELTLQMCQKQGIRYVVLAEGSPSCGSLQIYDGTFTGVKKTGKGVTTATLLQHGIQVFSQHSIANLKQELQA
ncbi:hypothetical protein VTH8203_03352 [Vibrio thalassae]|uniref:Uncharacterized protein n=1 Tax=Vibrio thalassae TaxID=1243014 RepID=A0A240EM54_9VIBR|nr:hypothetical protein VTH8203_03352 [Vibrio thalassae]